MSEENGKVCCNCRHNNRKWTDGKCECKCGISGDWLSYLRVMTGWCKHWAKERNNNNDEH